MNRTLRIVSTIALALGLALAGLPVTGDDAMTVSTGTGCCKQ